MPNLSQLKRERMLAFLQKIKDEHRDDDDMLIALGEIESELTSKKYGLVWEQHEEAVDVMMRDNIPVFTEVPEREITAAPGQGYNFILEGDNLHSLRLLEKTHKGKIDLIYIDPPYNTGNKDFIYDDAFVDKTDLFIHSKWLSFMEKRLKIARQLLSETGVIFISIDDNEQAQLKMLCDEIFGAYNFVADIAWEKADSPRMDAKLFSTRFDHTLVFARNIEIISIMQVETEEVPEHYNKIEPNGRRYYLKPLRSMGKNDAREARPNLYYPMIAPDGTEVFPVRTDGSDGNWRWSRAKVEANPELIEWVNSKNGWSPYYKIYADEHSTRPPETLWSFQFAGSNRNAKTEIKAVFQGDKSFDTPKPTKLIERILQIASSDDSIILDFFAGSGTTGHAVLKYNNAHPGSNRRFILCTNNESGICENVTYPRIKTVITGKRADGSDYAEGIPVNVKYYRTDFVSKDDEYLSDALLEHIREMIQLEHGVKIDGSQYLMVMSDEEADELQAHWSEYEGVKAIYASKEVLFTTEQNALFAGVEIHTIPDYYFNFELKEVGETW